MGRKGYWSLKSRGLDVFLYKDNKILVGQPPLNYSVGVLEHVTGTQREDGGCGESHVPALGAVAPEGRTDPRPGEERVPITRS